MIFNQIYMHGKEIGFFCEICRYEVLSVLPPESWYTVCWATKYQQLGIIALFREVNIAYPKRIFPEKVPLVRAKRKKSSIAFKIGRRQSAL